MKIPVHFLNLYQYLKEFNVLEIYLDVFLEITDFEIGTYSSQLQTSATM